MNMKKIKEVFGSLGQIGSVIDTELAKNLEVSCVISGTTSEKRTSRFIEKCKILKRFFDVEFAFPHSETNANEKKVTLDILLRKLKDREIDGVACFYGDTYKREISNLRLKFPLLDFSVDEEECLVSVVRKPSKTKFF